MSCKLFVIVKHKMHPSQKRCEGTFDRNIHVDKDVCDFHERMWRLLPNTLYQGYSHATALLPHTPRHIINMKRILTCSGPRPLLEGIWAPPHHAQLPHRASPPPPAADSAHRRTPPPPPAVSLRRAGPSAHAPGWRWRRPRGLARVGG